MKPQIFTVTTKVEIPKTRVADLLCCAFEGGSNYWCEILKTKAPQRFDFRYMPDICEKPCSYIDYPLNEGGYVIVGDNEGLMDEAVLDLATIARGINVFAKDGHRHWDTFMADNEDAETGDVFLQLCLWGENIYG